MTLAELGEKAKLSTSYLSQVERDKTTPSLSTLADIAVALDVRLRYFFETEAELAYVVRADVARDGLAPDQEACLRLTPEIGNSKLETHLVTLRPHAPSEQLPILAGEEFVFVVTGELAVRAGGEEFVLTAGDSIHYDAKQPHHWSNEGDEPCNVIWSRATAWL